MIAVSVIIPVYNVEKFLAESVESVCSQTLRNIEIILVNDGSTDASPVLCEEFKKKDKRIKLIHQKNKGLGGARNTGLSVAQGKYILFLDSDDWMEPFTCQIMYEKAEETNCDVVLSGETLYYETEKVYGKGWRDFSMKKDVEKFSAKTFLDYFTPAWGRLYRKKFLEKNNLKFPEKTYFEDNSWGCFIILYAQKYAFVKNCFFYRQRQDSITGKIGNKVLDWVKDYYYFRKTIKDKQFENLRLMCCYFWYLINFKRYFNKIDDKKLQKEFSYKLNYLLDVFPLDYKTLRYLCEVTQEDFNTLYLFIYENCSLGKKL